MPWKSLWLWLWETHDGNPSHNGEDQQKALGPLSNYVKLCNHLDMDVHPLENSLTGIECYWLIPPHTHLHMPYSYGRHASFLEV